MSDLELLVLVSSSKALESLSSYYATYPHSVLNFSRNSFMMVETSIKKIGMTILLNIV